MIIRISPGPGQTVEQCNLLLLEIVKKFKTDEENTIENEGFSLSDEVLTLINEEVQKGRMFKYNL